MNAGYDCHLHVIDPTRFPYGPGPGYLPGANEKGDAKLLAETFAANGIVGALLVQPSIYGTDNRCMLDAIEGAKGAYRGIAVIDPAINERELDELAAAGIVGIRLNAENIGPEVLEAAKPLLPRLIARDWFIQVQIRATALPEFVGMLTAPLKQAKKSKLIFDHLGYPAVERGIEEPGFQEVLRCGREGLALVKLSGAFRHSQEVFPHADLDPFAAALLDAFGPERCIFGSDWPFFGDVKPEYASTLAMIDRWLPNTDERRQVLIENPKRYFGLP
ncbi:MAG: amidohydrolase family protein [Pseudomonadota bacterium]